MKTVYFLRHGQTAQNRAFVHQYPETMLSPHGLEQARTAAEAFRGVPVDVIIASPLMRARQTADMLASVVQCPVEESALFEELRRPHDIWGRNWFAPKPLFTMLSIYLNAGRENWHHSDEENLEEFHARSRRALEYLAKRPEERILVVTHRGLMAALKERMLYDGLDTKAQYRRALFKTLAIGNCCYFTAHWSESGVNGATLDGTWTLDPGLSCPAGGRFELGLG